ncbi:PREDICTED: UDP-glucuronosyltransferase 2B37-like [Nicrophorus vespilloides]|uniref:UDP-glucuronosyltransferase n=1 Tax=Nicrophorus vespilloides TaxID=110193 RepID=A0ABM1MA43_NICVS|nr:PREDICTED: UDP-glucuronosyltransferase 2B37-like [Nicrophorus vespilloides]
MKKVGLFLLVLLAIGEGAKILAIIPFPSPSHQILASALLKELASRGHEVTMISPNPLKNPPKNYRDIVLDDIRVWKDKTMSVTKMQDASKWDKLKIIYEVVKDAGRIVLADPNLQSFLKEGQKFDLCIQMVGFMESLLPISHVVNATTIGFSPIGGMPGLNYHTGIPMQYSVIPNVFLPFNDEMGFFQRLINTVVGFLMDFVMYIFILPIQNSLAVEFFPNSPNIYELLEDVDLHLINSHYATESPRAHFPNMIQIGGFHLQEKQQLPEDIRSYMDSSKNGVILFSLGSNIKSADLPKEKLEGIMNAFAKSKYDILWKFEEKLPSNMKNPKNVKISSWLPQKAVLAHPKTVAFITHGGMGSTVEAIYNGVPMICIPFFGDQSKNTADSVHNGYAIHLDFKDVNEDTLTSAINEITGNPVYTKVVKLRSDIYKNQEINPMDKAVFWVEHAIKHRGAKHLKPRSSKIPWYQLMLIDVYAALFAILAVSSLISFYIIKKVINCFRAKKSKKVKTN